MTKDILEGYRKQYELELVKHEIEARAFKRMNIVKADIEIQNLINIAQRQAKLCKTRIEVIDTMIEELK